MVRRILVSLVVVGALIIAVAIGLELWPETDDTTVASATKTATSQAPAGSGQTGPASLNPSFDVVRTNPKGDTVIAGRAEPGSRVTVLGDGKTIGEVAANERGEWVFVPPAPLAPGTHRLQLESRLGAAEPRRSDAEVVMVVPEKGLDVAGRPTTGGNQPLAFKVPSQGSGATTVLQRPSLATQPMVLAIDAIDYDEAGRLYISGRAPASALVQLYLNNKFLGRAQADVGGLWTMSPDDNIEPGLYTLRADHINAAGKVLSRVSIPFHRAETVAALRPGGYVVVQPGNSLWRIARRTYGKGTTYTVIYETNSDQIRDADLIYPGQIFQLPITN